MLVPDASVIVLALIDAGSSGTRARGVLRDGASLHVPDLVDLEVVSALRRRRLSDAMERTTFERLVVLQSRLSARRWPARPLLARVAELADNLTSYDAAYVALAERLGAPLATADAGLARAPGVRCPVQLVR